MNKITITECVNFILLLDKNKQKFVGGMAGYGTRFDIHRDYYKSLNLDEKLIYEESILTLCQSNVVENATLGLYICSELADLFSKGWRDKVIDLVGSFVNIGLSPRYSNTISYSVIRLIRIFNIDSFTMFVYDYANNVTDQFKKGVVPKFEWETMYYEISRALITISPSIFWDEFNLLHKDEVLISLLEEKNIFAVISVWASTGVNLYGLSWLKHLTLAYSKFSSQTFKKIAYQVLEMEVSTLGEAKDNSEFLEWAKEKLESHK